MPFPWKKVKSARISQLVNDHLHISQKRRDGSSLVVATGFPTSLIDLFIKNREKLRNPSKRRRRSRSQPSNDVYDPVTEGGSLDYCPYPPPPSLVATPSPQMEPSALPTPSICEDEIPALQSSGGDSAVGQRSGGERGRDLNGVLIGVSKMFVVVVLALATRRLTVAITISAVLLLLLECVGKRCGGLSMPFAAAASMLRSAGRLIKCKKVEQKQERLVKSTSLPTKSSASRCEEIEAVESEVFCSEGIQPEVEESGCQEIELVEMEMRREESMCDVAPDLKRKSRKARIKSHMNKIVPKKFRGSKKYHDLQGPLILKDDSFMMPEDHCNNGDESENGSITSSISDGGYKSDICSDRRLPDVIEEAKAETVAARRYILLFLIVLVGLIGGRTFALVLTLLCFFLLKLGQKIPRRSIKLPCL